MATPNAAKSLEVTMQAELEAELRSAEQDFARGDFIELTVEQLDRCIEAGESPWASESSEEAPRSVAVSSSWGSERARLPVAR